MVGEAAVPGDVQNAGEGEEEGHDPRHPSERHERSQDSTRAVVVTPAKISPLFSGEGGTNDPQDEEEQEHS